MARLDSALVQAGITSSLDEARGLIRKRRVMICARQQGTVSCQFAGQPHQPLRGKRWALIGDRIVRFDAKLKRFVLVTYYQWDSPMGGSRRRK